MKISPDADDLNESHIPQYVKMEIINTNLIKRATAANIEQYDYEQKNNEFKDKVHIVETPKKGGTGLNEALDGMCKLAKALVDKEDLNPITSKYCF